jgi:hypothetical protein
MNMSDQLKDLEGRVQFVQNPVDLEYKNLEA